MLKVLDNLNEFYVENRKLGVDTYGTEYYYLPTKAVEVLGKALGERDGVKYTSKVTPLLETVNSPTVLVKATLYIDGVETHTVLGSADNVVDPDTRATPWDYAEASAVGKLYKRVYPEYCNLPEEYSVVDREQEQTAGLEELEAALPEVEVKAKAEPTKEKAKKPAAKTAKPKKVEPKVEVKEEEVAEEKAPKAKAPAKKAEKKEVEKDVDVNDEALEEALNHVINVGNMHYDGKTIAEIIETDAGVVLLGYYAQRVDNKRFAEHKDFAEKAKLVLESLETEEVRAKHS